MAKHEKFDHLHLICHFTVTLKATLVSKKIKKVKVSTLVKRNFEAH